MRCKCGKNMIKEYKLRWDDWPDAASCHYRSFRWWCACGNISKFSEPIRYIPQNKPISAKEFVENVVAKYGKEMSYEDMRRTDWENANQNIILRLRNLVVSLWSKTKIVTA